ncbi:MAG: D-amino acid aminotransferase [Oceanicaulis sp.]|nr:D-amino acid aminotransferase [Oceanicaulis sp.]MBI76098.1 D-amino acid aminotransferase [Oceanicaulis sp.]
MSRIAYVNGRFQRHDLAAVHIEDRGFQFADAIYEVWAVRKGELLDAEGHFDRLDRSLGELRIAHPVTRAALTIVIRELIRRNRIGDGLVYLQISRGRARRDHGFPPPGTRPTLVLTAKRLDLDAVAGRAAQGVSVISVPDQRWARCDIKTVNLLPNTLAKQAARDAGAYEAWQVDADGFVTEGTSSNAWILTADGALVTRPADHAILHGITRATLIRVATSAGYRLEERPFTIAEALEAREAFLTSATNFVMPVTRIDGRPVANGEPGSVSAELRQAYLAAV